MNDHKCHECGQPLSTRTHTVRTRVGRYDVDDASRMLPVCVNGHPELSLDDLAEYERRAAAVVLSEAADIGGPEIRFARKALGLTQSRLGVLLDVAPETVSRWETGAETMSRVSRLALLAVVRDPSALGRLENEPARPSEVLRVAGSTSVDEPNCTTFVAQARRLSGMRTPIAVGGGEPIPAAMVTTMVKPARTRRAQRAVHWDAAGTPSPLPSFVKPPAHEPAKPQGSTPGAAPEPRISNWNGRDLGWEGTKWNGSELRGAEWAFAAFSNIGVRARVDHRQDVRGKNLARDVADIADAAAWMLNRSETMELAGLAKLARRWLAKSRPLISDHDEVGKAVAAVLSEPFADELSAYRFAVKRVEELFDKYGKRPIRNSDGSESSEKWLSRERNRRMFAFEVVLAIRAPLPRLSVDPNDSKDEVLVGLAQKIERARQNGRCDGQSLVNSALRRANIEPGRLKQMINAFGKKPL